MNHDQRSNAKTATRPQEIPADQVSIRFGPKVRETLEEIGRLTYGKPDFDDDARALLETLTGKAPLGINSAISRLAIVIQEATEFELRHPEGRLNQALLDLTAHLTGVSGDMKPLIVSISPKSIGPQK